MNIYTKFCINAYILRVEHVQEYEKFKTEVCLLTNRGVENAGMWERAGVHKMFLCLETPPYDQYQTLHINFKDAAHSLFLG